MSVEFFAEGGARTLACVKISYGGYSLSISNIMMRGSEGSVFAEHGRFVFEFPATLEGLIQAKQKIDRLNRKKAAS